MNNKNCIKVVQANLNFIIIKMEQIIIKETKQIMIVIINVGIYNIQHKM